MTDCCAWCFSAGPDLLARCAQDRGGVWLHAPGAPLPGLLLPPQCAGLPLSGHPHRHPVFPCLQEHHGRRAEEQRWPPLQVSRHKVEESVYKKNYKKRCMVGG